MCSEHLRAWSTKVGMFAKRQTLKSDPHRPLEEMVRAQGMHAHQLGAHTTLACAAEVSSMAPFS